MRQSQRTLTARFAVVGLLGLGLLMFGSGCKEPIPAEGVFPIKVIALTGDKVGIANAEVLINGKPLGKTDKFGTFVGTYSGKVSEWISIQVVGQGAGNLMKVRSKLKMRKTQNGWVPAEVKVEAFLRPVLGNGVAGTPGFGDPGQADAGAIPPIANANGTRSQVPAPPRSDTTEPRTDTQPAVTVRNVRRRVAYVRPNPVDPPIDRRVDPPAAPSFDGRYNISVNANADGVKVSLRGRRSARGFIAQAGTAGVIKYRDRSNPPKPIKVTFQIRKNAWMYKESKIVKDLNLQHGQADHSIEATFEKKPPIKIKVKANIAGIKVYLNGSMKGEISDPATPLELEYVGPRRSASIRLVPSNRKVRPRRISTRVSFKADQFEYMVEKQFTPPPEPRVRADVPTPPIARTVDPPVARVGGGDPPPPIRVDTPVAPKRSSGLYLINITANVDGVYVKNGRRRLGFIPQAGGILSYKHKDRRVPPRPLTLTFQAKDRFAYMERTVRKEVPLEVGREDGYRVEAQFEKRKPIKIICKSNAQGTKVYVNGKAKGEISSPGQPLEVEYNGRPTRRLKVEFRSPNPRTFRPAKVRKTVNIVAGTFEYSLEATFSEKSAPDKVLTASCFRRAGGRKRTVSLLAREGTTIVLIGDCNNEQLGRTGKSGRLRVKMPVGSFQRVKAVFADGADIRKVFEVASGGGEQPVRLSSGGARCNLNRITKKVYNKIRLESEEIGCLQNVKKPSPQFFSSQLSLARYFCSRRKRSKGKTYLAVISRNPRNRFDPYRALKMGIELGRCREQSKAIDLLKQAERLINRIPPVDRYANKKALYRAMSQIYEQRYYRQKNAVDLTRSLKLMERLRDIARGSDGDTKSFATNEVTRLKKLVSSRGGGLDE